MNKDLFVYEIFDSETKELLDVCTAITDGQFIRGAVPRLNHALPTKDMIFWKVGCIDRETGEMSVLPERLPVSLDSYEFPDRVGTNHVSASVSNEQAKADFEQKTRDVVENGMRLSVDRREL